MKKQPEIVESVEVRVQRPKRLSYTAPTLTRYGSVGDLTMGNNGTIPDSNVGTRMGASERQLKQHISRIGTHPLGIGLYLFDYKPEYRDAWGHGRQFGVMADEVEHVVPEAVSSHPGGYRMVDYAKLGIDRYGR